MEVRQALQHVSEIRAQLARTEHFRGYRSLTVGFTGLVGVLAAVGQALWLPQPTADLRAFLTLWVGAAVINLLVVGVEIWSRTRTAAFALARHATVFAIGQFLPALVVGGLLTLVIVERASESAWMLPGLWAIVFSLGVFASCRLLPPAVLLAGAWYVACGILALAYGQGTSALSPWLMGIAFGGGQLLTAALLYFTLERFHDRMV